MRRVVPLASCFVLLVASTSASAGVRGDRRPITTKTVIHLRQQVIDGTSVDVDPPGESLGDQFVSSSLLLQHGTRVGRMEATCTVTNLTPGAALCEAAIRLHKGQVAAMGRLPMGALSGQQPVRVAVVGGTGAYRNAGGFVSVTPTQANAKLKLVLLP
ncbi:MAG TPA: hypothetical protein VI341_11235 [Actinomycetota bacterium]